jgi:Holliday junction resolvase RusA-like endonuclease
MKNLKIILPYKPIPLSRSRLPFRKSHFYDPQYEIKERLRQYIKTMFLPTDFTFIQPPFVIHYTFHFEMPKTWSNKKKDRMHNTPHLQRPDNSNLVKFYEDAFNGFIFEDDAQIWNYTCQKKWFDKNQAMIQIIELKESSAEKS